jgi:pyruvate dehydrogenase E2 component (dihydrolipoamide acetyltransferase)
MNESRHQEFAAREFALPDVGEGLTEAEILTWRVSVGDTVAINDVIVDIETAKSIVELPSPFAGVVMAILVAEGETVPVGTPIIAIGGVTTAAPAAGIEASDTATEPERQPTLVGYGVRTGESRRRRKVPVDLGTVVPLHVSDDPRDRRVLAKPPVRKLAKDLGIDLRDVHPSGPVITRADVEAHAANHGVSRPVAADVEPVEVSSEPRQFAPSEFVPSEFVPPEFTQPSFVTASPADVRLPVKGVRKVMAETMARSAFTAPQATEWLTLDVSRTVELVERLRADRAFAGIRVSPTVIVAKSVCLAMRNSPLLNACWVNGGSDDAGELLVRGSINLGIAVATDRGLIVPNIPSAERLSMVELARELERVTTTARAGRVQPADASGGTFTITNVGVFGVDAGTPILNLGETGILAVGAIQRRPWVADDDSIVARWVTTLALTFDHRVADGAEASKFLTDIADILRDPATALTY